MIDTILLFAITILVFLDFGLAWSEADAAEEGRKDIVGEMQRQTELLRKLGH